MSRKFVFILILAAFISAYSPMPVFASHPNAESMAKQTASGMSWVVSQSLKGGIAGLNLFVVVSSNGEYAVVDVGKGRVLRGTLLPAELTELDNLIAGLGPVKSLQPGESRCRDCFLYALEVQRGAERISVQTDDVNIKDSGAGGLIGYLRALIFATLK